MLGGGLSSEAIKPRLPITCRAQRPLIIRTSRCGKLPTTRRIESEWLPHKPTRKEAENRPPAREVQTPPKIFFSPWMQNCTPSCIRSSPRISIQSVVCIVTRFEFPLLLRTRYGTNLKSRMTAD